MIRWGLPFAAVNPYSTPDLEDPQFKAERAVLSWGSSCSGLPPPLQSPLH